MGQLLSCKLESSNRDLRISPDNARARSKESLPKSYEMNRLRVGKYRIITSNFHVLRPRVICASVLNTTANGFGLS